MGIDDLFKESKNDAEKCKGQFKITINDVEYCPSNHINCKYKSHGIPKLVGHQFYRRCCYPIVPGESKV